MAFRNRSFVHFIAICAMVETLILINACSSFVIHGTSPLAISLSPSSAVPGATVTVNGFNLNSTTAVTLSGNRVAYTVTSPRSLAVTIPAGAKTGPLAVSGNNGTTTSPGILTILQPPPSVSSIDPASGQVGTSVAISGSGFTGASAVALNGIDARYTINSDTSITTIVPQGATSGQFVVQTPTGESASLSFQVTVPDKTVFWNSEPTNPDETVLVAGSGFTPDTLALIARADDQDPGDPLSADLSTYSPWNSVTPLQTSFSSLKFVIPQSMSPGVFAYALTNSDGSKSTAHLLNTPDLWFVQGDQGDFASPGGWIDVYGNCLYLSGSPSENRPHLILAKEGVVVADLQASAETVTNDSTSGYMESFVLPQSIEPGQYQVYFHNGNGGPSAWTTFSSFGPPSTPSFPFVTPGPITTFTIAPPQLWPLLTYKAPPPHDDGSPDDKTLLDAVSALTAAKGGIILLGSGTYHLTEPLALPNHTILGGQSQSGTILKFDGSFKASSVLIAGAQLPGWGNAVFSIQNLTVSAPTMTVGAAVALRNMIPSESSARPYIRNVAINVANGNFDGSSTVGVTLSMIQNVDIENTEIDAPQSILASGYVFYLRVEHCKFYWRYITLWLRNDVQNLVVENNSFVVRGNPDVNEYPQAGNSGLSFAAYSSPYARDLYYARNITTNADSLSSTGEYCSNCYGITSDGNANVFFGKTIRGTPTSVTLASGTSAVTNGAVRPVVDSTFWTGGVIMILDGRGAGQWRTVVSNVPGDTLVQTDRPWDVIPDNTSTVMICSFIGRALFVANTYGLDPTNQAYFMSHDIIQANNQMSTVDPAIRSSYVISRFGGLGGGIVPGWHFQALKNTVTADGGGFFIFADLWPSSYNGSVSAQQVVRGNVFNNDVAGWLLGESYSSLSDLVIENNVTPNVRIRTPGAGMVSGILIRGNKANTLQGGPSPVELPANQSGILVIPPGS